MVAMVTTKWLPYLEVLQDQSFQSLLYGRSHEFLQLFWLGDMGLLREHDTVLDGSHVLLQNSPPIIHWSEQRVHKR